MDKDSLGCVMSFFVMLLIVIVFTVDLFLDYRAPETIQGLVTNSYVKRYGEEDYFHIVVQHTDGQEEVFQNRDALLLFKFNSADLQAKIEIGERYEFKVRGTRWRFVSKFRNIINAEIIQTE